MTATTITRHWSENHDLGFDGYVMLSFFSFHDGQLHIGQSQTVPVDKLEIEREAMKRHGRTLARYKYVNGRAVLVEC